MRGNYDASSRDSAVGRFEHEVPEGAQGVPAQTSASPAEHGGSADGVCRNKDSPTDTTRPGSWLASATDLLVLLRSAVTSLALLVLATVLGIATWKQLFEPSSVLVEPLTIQSLPTDDTRESLALTQLLLVEIERIQTMAETTHEAQGYFAEVQRTDLEIPGAELSFRGMIRFLRENLTDRPAIRIGGSLVADSNGYALSMRVDDGRGYVAEVGPDVALRPLLREAAAVVVGHLEPYILARYYYKTDDWDKAGIACERTLATYPARDDKWAHQLIGHIALKRGHLWRALDSYSRGQKLDPAWPNAYNNMGWALLRLNRHEEAERMFREAIARDRERTYAAPRNNWGVLALSRGDYGEAVELFKSALGMEPYWSNPYYNLTRALFRIGEYADAVAACQRAIELRRTWSDAHVVCGRVRVASGDLHGAIDAFDAAVALKHGKSASLRQKAASLRKRVEGERGD